MSRTRTRKLTALLFGTVLLASSVSATQAQTNSPIVFLIVIENHNWVGSGGIGSSAEAPYINKTLAPMGAVAGNYFNPPGNHPSLPNYLWMEAGTNLGVHTDGLPSRVSPVNARAPERTAAERRHSLARI